MDMLVDVNVLGGLEVEASVDDAGIYEIYFAKGRRRGKRRPVPKAMFEKIVARDDATIYDAYYGEIARQKNLGGW